MGYGIARRLKLEQEGYIFSEWGSRPPRSSPVSCRPRRTERS
jgi:hypothetical protein